MLGFTLGLWKILTLHSGNKDIQITYRSQTSCSQDLDKEPLPWQRMLMRLQGYSLYAKHVPFADDVEYYIDLLKNPRLLTDRLLEQI